MTRNNRSLILASKSKARQNMLRGAGLSFDCMPANIDEDTIKTKGHAPSKVAEILAQQKSLHIAGDHADALVIGADQVLVLNDQLLSKAAHETEAKDKLKRLRGKTHTLISSVSIARGTDILWTHSDTAHLTMHNFDDETLERYMEKAGEGLTRSVGAYELEGAGAWLFEKVEGDFFTILGMPLLPLLHYLREDHGVLP